jgi:glc operon protein GlcG
VLAAARTPNITRRRARYKAAFRVRLGYDLAIGERKYSRELERIVMPVIRQQTVITVSAALDLIHAAIAEGDLIGVPVSACVVDTSMSLVAFARSDGATPHSADTSRAKANTAASIGRPTGGMGEDLALPLAVATGGRLTNIHGGSPIRFDDAHAGGLGIAGGTPLQDAEVAEAALARVGAQPVPRAH